jgi:ATP-dependent DNA ligase
MLTNELIPLGLDQMHPLPAVAITPRQSRDGIPLVEHIDATDSHAVFALAYRLGLEGIVSKRRDSMYRPGRWRVWLKIKSPVSPAAKRIEMGSF